MLKYILTMNLSECKGKDNSSSSRWMLESIQIDQLQDLAMNDESKDITNEVSNEKYFKRNNRIVKKVMTTINESMMNQLTTPRIERSHSGAHKGINSLRFLDKAMAGKEADAWKSIEKRFYQNSKDGRLSRDKFGFCIGKVLLIFF